MRVISGPHMYSDDCSCHSCVDARSSFAKYPNRKHYCVSIKSVRNDAMAVRDNIERFMASGSHDISKRPPSCMRVHYRVLLELCELALGPNDDKPLPQPSGGRGDPDDADNQGPLQEDALDCAQHYGLASIMPVGDGEAVECIVAGADGALFLAHGRWTKINPAGT